MSQELWDRDERALNEIIARNRSRPPRRRNRVLCWVENNVAFVSWHKHWKGVYLHCIHPRYCVRVFLWGIDWHLKPKHALASPNVADEARR